MKILIEGEEDVILKEGEDLVRITLRSYGIIVVGKKI